MHRSFLLANERTNMDFALIFLPEISSPLSCVGEEACICIEPTSPELCLHDGLIDTELNDSSDRNS